MTNKETGRYHLGPMMTDEELREIHESLPAEVTSEIEQAFLMMVSAYGGGIDEAVVGRLENVAQQMDLPAKVVNQVVADFIKSKQSG